MASRKRPSVSVFFPCFNDAKTIGKLINTSIKVLKKVSSSYEVIVINDGSTDNSKEVVEEIVKKNKKVRLINHSKNKGYGGALRTGFKAAKKNLIFYTDGDGQYDVNEIALLLPMMTPDVNFVNGIKMRRGDLPYRVFFGNLHKFINRWLFWLPVYDVDCDFRLIRKNLIEKIKLKSNSGSICIELVKKAERAGAVFRQISVHHYDRKYGSSQFFKIDKIIATYIDIAKLWFQLVIQDYI